MSDTYELMEVRCVRCGEMIFFLLRKGNSRGNNKSCNILPLCKKCQEKYLVDDIKEDKE